jgi:hypothetical protein
MRRDRRSEDCVLEPSRSHPAGVICAQGKKKEHSEDSRPCSFPARHPEPAAAGEGPLFDSSPSARGGLTARTLGAGRVQL